MWTLTVSLTSNPAEPNMSLLLRTPVLIPQSHRPNWHETDLKPTKIIKFGERSVYSRYWFGFVGLVSVYVRADKFVGRDLSNMFERSLSNKLSVVCGLYVGVVSVLSGSVRGRVGLNSATDGRWFVGLKSVMYRAYVGRPDTDSRPNQVRHNTELGGVGRHIPESKPTSARHISNPNRMQTDYNRLWRHTYI